MINTSDMNIALKDVEFPTRILTPIPKSSPAVQSKISHSIKSELKRESVSKKDKKDKIIVSEDKKDKNIQSGGDVPEIDQKLYISNTKWIAPTLVTSILVELLYTRGQVVGTWMVWLLEKPVRAISAKD